MSDTDALTAGMSDLIRADAASHRAVRDGSASPLALALDAAQRELAAAEAIGDELRADHASRRVDAILDAAREAADDVSASTGAAMRQAAGARPPHHVADMNEAIREAAMNRRA
jgi:hypothetical protein